MNVFNIWGQIQEISTGRLLVIATACPVTAGRQAVLSAVATNRDTAVSTLDRLIDELREQLSRSGNSVVSINRVTRGHSPPLWDSP